MRNSIKHVLLAAYTNSVTWIRSPRVWFVHAEFNALCAMAAFTSLAIRCINLDGRLHPLNAFSLLPLGKGC